MNGVLQTTPAEHVEAAERIAAEAKTVNQQKRRVLKELAGLVGEKLGREATTNFIEYHNDDADMGFMQEVAREVRKKKGETAVVFLTCGSMKESSGQFLVAGKKEVVQGCAKEVAELLEGKGGGGGETFQGKVGSFKKRKEVVKLIQEKSQ